jgi:hypothetical protein
MRDLPRIQMNIALSTGKRLTHGLSIGWDDHEKNRQNSAAGSQHSIAPVKL